ncbi:MAG: chorismate synthase [Campylobacteraceae bacterium]|jgi:chorismate synthase|nr:chorismate synthase [Campylobacteraceae bacterium]
MNSFGIKFRVTTFGESHGDAIGCVIDGVPAGLEIDGSYIQDEVDKRKPGVTKFATQRKESDKVRILSGVFEGLSTGAPIALIIFNENQKSSDYENIKSLFRPSHADFTYFKKYGIRDYRGGGRSSARETAARVAAGAVAKKLLKKFNIEVKSGVFAIGGIEAEKLDFEYAKTSEIFALDRLKEEAQKAAVLGAKEAGDSVGGCVFVKISNVPAGLGEPLYNKLDAALAGALIGINGVKAVETGEGVNASKLKGSQNNDQMDRNGFISNHAGGILGGISTGEDIDLKVHFKPTPSVFLKQQTQNETGESVEFSLKGRHDPCIAVRGSVVANAMASLAVADMLLLNASCTINNLKKIYG